MIPTATFNRRAISSRVLQCTLLARDPLGRSLNDRRSRGNLRHTRVSPTAATPMIGFQLLMTGKLRIVTALGDCRLDKEVCNESGSGVSLSSVDSWLVLEAPHPVPLPAAGRGRRRGGAGSTTIKARA